MKKEVNFTHLTRSVTQANGEVATNHIALAGAPSTVLNRLKRALAWPGAALYTLSKQKEASYNLPDGTTEYVKLTAARLPLTEIGDWIKGVQDLNKPAPQEDKKD